MREGIAETSAALYASTLSAGTYTVKLVSGRAPWDNVGGTVAIQVIANVDSLEPARSELEPMLVMPAGNTMVERLAQLKNA